MTGNILEATIEAWHESPTRVFFVLLLIEALLIIMLIAGELIMACVIGIIALILFIGGILLVFSIKPRGYKNAAWMSGIAFFLLWNYMENIKAFEISFLNAMSILKLTAVVFIVLGLYEKHHIKQYAYATLTFFYIVTAILSH